MLAHREFDIFQHIERREQRALLEQHAPIAANALAFMRGELGKALAEHGDLAPLVRDEAGHGPHGHGLARAGGTNEAEDFAAAQFKAQPIDNGDRTKADGEVVNRHGGGSGYGGGAVHLEPDRGKENGEQAVGNDNHEDGFDNRGGGAAAQ